MGEQADSESSSMLFFEDLLAGLFAGLPGVHAAHLYPSPPYGSKPGLTPAQWPAVPPGVPCKIASSNENYNSRTFYPRGSSDSLPLSPGNYFGLDKRCWCAGSPSCPNAGNLGYYICFDSKCNNGFWTGGAVYDITYRGFSNHKWVANGVTVDLYGWLGTWESLQLTLNNAGLSSYCLTTVPGSGT